MTIEEILQLGKEAEASDIHMAQGSPLLFRVDGRLVPQNNEILKQTDIEKIIKAVMSKEQLVELERNGEMDFAFSLSGFSRVRVNVFRQQGTYAASFRMLSYDVPTPEELGIPAPVVELTNCKSGLILVTGAAGSGKSTTLASLVDAVAGQDYKNIITIENPIEYIHSYKKSIVSQREIGVDTDTYAKGVQAALRQDPDIIMIGELQDVETIAMALAAAEAGYLVLSALYTSSTADALKRVIEVFPPYRQQQIRVQLASVLKGVIAQQLLPRVDVKGRISVFEVLLANQAVQQQIREDKVHQISGIIQRSRKQGMQSMDDAILEAYMRSEITMDTALAYAHDAEAMAQKVQIF